MEQLTIVGTEGMTLVLATEHGQRFTLEIDDMLRGEVRKARAVAEPKPVSQGPNPREIQAHIRAGLTAEEVAELLGCDIARVRPFEGPVLAEREHIVDRALAMPVLRSVQVDLDDTPSFGSVIREKLADLSATQERWTSWKTDEGWVIKLTFEVGGVERDARWSFDPRRSALAPTNDDATQLSRQGKVAEELIPRLRALDVVDEPKDASTFDEQSFQEEEPEPAPEPEKPADTADLLEALRRKRGQREAAQSQPERPAATTATSRPMARLSPTAESTEQSTQQQSTQQPPAPQPAAEQPAATQTSEPESAQTTREQEPETNSGSDSSKRRRRPSMPSWDEIVFGARGDD